MCIRDRFNRDTFVLNEQQDQNNAEAALLQQGENADKGDEIRAQSFEQFQQGLDRRGASELLGAGAFILGALASSFGLSLKDLTDKLKEVAGIDSSNPTNSGTGGLTGNDFPQGSTTTAPNSNGSGSSNNVDPLTGADTSNPEVIIPDAPQGPVTAPTTPGSPSSPTSTPSAPNNGDFADGAVGNQDVGAIEAGLNARPPGVALNDNEIGSDIADTSIPNDTSGNPPVGSSISRTGRRTLTSPSEYVPEYFSNSSESSSPQSYDVGEFSVGQSDYAEFLSQADPSAPSQGVSSFAEPASNSGSTLPGAFGEIAEGLSDPRVDEELRARGEGLFSVLDRMTPEQRDQELTNYNADLLAARGLLNDEEANEVKANYSRLKIATDPNATRSERLAASESFVAGAPIEAPGAGLNASNIGQALLILNGDQSDSDKVVALGQIGLTTPQAQQIIGNTGSNALLTILQAYQVADNWEDAGSFDKAIGIANVTTGVYATYAASQAAATGAAVAGAAYIPYVGAVIQAAGAINSAQSVLSQTEDLPRSQAPEEAGRAFSSIHASIAAPGAGIASNLFNLNKDETLALQTIATGGLNLVHAAIGATLGSFGSGKGSGQKIRDRWRENLTGAEVIDGSHHVTLADGSKYDIGKDGGHKLQNVGQNIDGSTERSTFDVDFSNPIAVSSIPSSHVFSIATGINPTEGFDGFSKIAAQGLNAATSNANSPAEVKANYKSMLEANGQTAQTVMFRMQILRATNQINDHHFRTYSKEVSEIFGESISYNSKESFVSTYQQFLADKDGPPTESEQRILNALSDEGTLQSNQQKLDELISRGVL